MSKRPDDQVQAAFDAARAEAEQMPSADVQARVRAQFLSEARGESVSPNGVARLIEQEGALPELTVQERKPEMSRRTLRFVRVAAAALLGVMVVGGLLWASPSLRALAQEIINFIVQGEDEQPSIIFVGGDSDPEWMHPPELTLEEIVAQTEFDMRVPTFMPTLYRFMYAIYFSDGVTPVLYYDCPYDPWAIMIVQDMGEKDSPVEVGASAVIEEVPIRDTVGQYVRGFWRIRVDEAVRREQEAVAREQNEAVGVPATMVWSNEIEHQQLAWREDGINFRIQTAGFSSGDTRNPCPLTKEDYVAIAEGLKPASEVER